MFVKSCVNQCSGGQDQCVQICNLGMALSTHLRAGYSCAEEYHRCLKQGLKQECQKSKKECETNPTISGAISDVQLQSLL